MNDLITIKRYPIETTNLYHDLLGLVGKNLTQIEFDMARLEIKKIQSSKYYTVFNGQEIRIDKNGRLKNWPEGFFDTWEKIIMKLI